MIDLLGRIPDEDEHPEISFSHFTFTVLEMEEKRIAKIKITMNNPAERRPHESEM